MANEQGVVRSVSWRDLCPWTILFRLYRLSVSLQLIILAFLGAWATSAGWKAFRAVCLSEESRAQPQVARFIRSVDHWPNSIYWQIPSLPVTSPRFAVDIAPSDASPPADALTSLPSEAPGELAAATTTEPQSDTSPPTSLTAGAVTRVLDDGGPLARFWHGALGRTPMYAIMEPVRRWFDPTLNWEQLAFYLGGGLWTLLVWSLIGGAITRTAVVRLGRDERVGLRESLEFSSRKLLSLLGATLLPLAAIFALGIPLFILGLLMRTNVGIALGGLLWLPVGLIAFSMALFAIGVLFGWPLMWSTIATEGSDAFDAISRSYAYTYQRPLQYLAYFLGALLLGFLGWLMVGLFCQAIVQMALLAVGAGTGSARMDVLRSVLADRQASPSVLLTFGAALIGFFNRCFLGLQVAFAYSFMWSAAGAIYLLLRHDADQTEMDDVFLEEDETVRYGLPPLTVDEAGVPGTIENETEPTSPGTSGASASPTDGSNPTGSASAESEREQAT
jgi:hypothetical protein